MSKVDISKVLVSSFTQGLGYEAQQPGVINVGAFSFFSSSHRVFSTVIPASTEAGYILKVKFSGVGNASYNGQWVIVLGRTYFRNLSPSYDITVYSIASASGIEVVVDFYNDTVSSTQNVPNITVDIEIAYFSAPWA